MNDTVRWELIDGSAGRLLEGPSWISEAAVFQWVDILRASIFRWDPYAGRPAQRRELDLEFVTVALPLDSDRSIVASRNSLHEYRWSDGTLRSLGTWEFPPDVRFNDGAVSPDGEVYIGTMSMNRRRGAAHLYRFKDGLTPVLSGIGISNGLAWDAANRAFYVDSLTPQVNLIDLSSPTPILTPFATLEKDDEPDGLAVHPQGGIVVALWMGGRLASISSSGVRRHDIAVPASSPTSVAFGGEHQEVLVVTTAETVSGRAAESGGVWAGRLYTSESS